MKTLKFQKAPRLDIPGSVNLESSIDETVMQEFKDKINLMYSDLIDEINACNGYIEYSISNNGKSIAGWQLRGASAEIYDAIHSKG